MRLVKNAMVALVITAAVPVLASAQTKDAPGAPPVGAPPAGAPAGGEMRGGPGGMQQMLFEGITLTDAQKADLDKVRASFREEGQALRAQLTPGTPPDDAFRAKMQDFQKRQMEAYRKVLTEDQQKTFDANVAEIQKRMEQMRRGN